MPALIDELKGVPLFSSLSQRQLKRLAHDFREREFRPGTAVVQQGQMSGIGFFVTAEDRLRCLEITFWDFRRFAQANPDVSWKLLRHVGDLLSEQRGRTTLSPG